MKRFKNILRTLSLAVFILLTTQARANAAFKFTDGQIDSLQISLLTCSPGTAIWSVFGHTAIRVYNPGWHQDIAVNYGMFSFNKSNFVLRFVFGLTDYEMGIEPMEEFVWEYSHRGRGITEQRLNLTREEKAAIFEAIAYNYRPENRVYRYNYFYDNCTTRARDMIENHLSGKVDYQVDPNIRTSYREMVHRAVEDHPWYRFGYDLLLGIGSDQKTDYRAQQFLPDSLMSAFGKAKVTTANGEKIPLVDSTSVLLPPMAENAPEETFADKFWGAVTPTWIFLGIFIISLSLLGFSVRKTWIFDAILLPIVGLAGFVLVAMIFSEHPTVKVNLQLLLLNPLALIFAYPAIRQGIKGKTHWFWKYYIVCLVLFFIAIFIQNTAEGMDSLALALLCRCISYFPNNWFMHRPKVNNKV